MFSGPSLVLAPTDFRKYRRVIKTIGKLIDSIGGETVDLDFFNAVLLLVEDAREGCQRSKNTRLQREWNFLNQSLATLYGHVDPDLDQHNFMVLGKNLAARMERAMVAA